MNNPIMNKTEKNASKRGPKKVTDCVNSEFIYRETS